MKQMRFNREKYVVISVFLLVFLSASFLVTNNIISASLTIGMWLVLLVLSLSLTKMKLSVRAVFCAAIISAMMFFTDIMQGEDFTVTWKVIFTIIVVCFLASAISFEEFSSAYVKIMKFLCIVSLTGYFLYLIVPQMFDLFASTYGEDTPYSNWIIYIQYLGKGSSANRNYGFTWEPGAFSTFVCLAMLLDVFVVSKRINLKSVFLYFITAITTFSTTGIVAILSLCLYIAFVNKSVSKSVRRTFLLIIAAAIIVVILFSDLFAELFFSTANYSTFGKLILFFDSGGEKSSSVGVRINAVTEAFNAFLESPLYGWGYDGLGEKTYELTQGNVTCTFINWFAVYGLLFGLIMWGLMYLLSKRISFGGINRFVVFLYLFGITSTENYVRSPFFFLIAFYGLIEYNKKISEKAQYELVHGSGKEL